MDIVPEKLITDLLEALNRASDDENYLAKHIADKKIINQDKGWRTRLSDITQVELPDRFGKLLSTLDLQKEFTGLQHHIRSFDDAAAVVTKMKAAFIDRLHGISSKEKIDKIHDVVFMCNEMGRIVAGLTVPPLKLNVKEDDKEDL